MIPWLYLSEKHGESNKQGEVTKLAESRTAHRGGDATTFQTLRWLFRNVPRPQNLL